MAENLKQGVVNGRVSYLGSNVGVSLVRAGPQTIAAHCSSCGDADTPNLCWHSATLLGHLLYKMEFESNNTLTIESHGSLLVAHLQNGRHAPSRPLETKLTQMGFVRSGSKLVLDVRENPTDAYRATSQWLSPMARSNDIHFADDLLELALRDHELYVDFAISGGKLIVKLRSNALNKGELLGIISANRGRSIQGARATYASKGRLVMWSSKESRTLELLALLGITPSAACNTYGAALPLAMAFRAKAAIERLYQDVKVVANSLDEFCSMASGGDSTSCEIPQHLDGQLKS